MLSVSVDTTALSRKLDALDRARPAAAEDSIREGGDVFVAFVERHSRRDTQRFVRGWVMAGNLAGLTPRPVPDVKESSRQARFIEGLVEQEQLWLREFTKWDRLERTYRAQSASPGLKQDGTPRARRTSQPYFRVILKQKRFAEKRLTRARQELHAAQSSPGALIVDSAGLFFAGGRLPGVGVGSAIDSGLGGRYGYTKSGRRKLTTVRTKVYGGRGSVEDIGGVVVLSLHNLEAHATLVERRDRVVARAMANAKAFGVGRMSRRYVARLRSAA